jgi:hypothetical protein
MHTSEDRLFGLSGLSGSFSLFGAEVPNEAGSYSRRLVGLLVYRVERALRHIVLIHCDIHVTLYLSRGRHSDEQELSKLLVRTAHKPFGNVCHYRPSCALDLTTKPNILLPPGILMDRVINQPRQLPRFFPTVQIFKTSQLHNKIGLFGLSGLFRLFRLTDSELPIICAGFSNQTNQTNLFNLTNAPFGRSSALSLTGPLRPSTQH